VNMAKSIMIANKDISNLSQICYQHSVTIDKQGFV
jgi:hypothetical protein